MCKHLESLYTKQKNGAGSSHGRVTNRPFMNLFKLNTQETEAGIVDNLVTYDRIIIVLLGQVCTRRYREGARGSRRGGQRQTKTDRDRQRQTETDRDGQRRIETDRDR